MASRRAEDPASIPPDNADASLRRTLDTARALMRAGAGPLLPFSGVREIYCGVAEGLPLGEVQQHWPDLWEANLRQDDDDFRWPGGESYREFRARCLRALEEIAARHTDGRVAVVTHAGVISQVVGAMSRTRPAEWERFRPANTALTTLRRDGSAAELVCFDDHRHLNT